MPDPLPPVSADPAEVRRVLAARSGETVALSVLYGPAADARAFALPGELDDAVRWVGDVVAPGRTVSLGVATLAPAGRARLDEARQTGRRARPRHGEHAGYAWVAADLDPGDGVDVDALRERLDRFPLRPSMLVRSGRGLHAWWRLSAPVDLATGRGVIEDLARALEADAGAADEGRALRLPGTYAKPSVGGLAVVDELTDASYPAAELAAAARALAPPPTPTPPPPARPRPRDEDLDGPDTASRIRNRFPLAEELDRVAGPPRHGFWRCPAGHDDSASLKLHPADRERWVCFGTGHPPEFGRGTSTGRHSGDVVDLLAFEAGLSPARFLADERQRAAPPRRAPAPRTSPLPAPAAATASPPPPASGGKKAREPSQADQLLELAEARYRLGTSAEGPYAVLTDGPPVVRLLRGGARSLRSELAHLYSQAHGNRAPSQGALADAMTVLEGRAEATSEPVALGLRVAGAGDQRIVLDLGDTDGRMVTADPSGWRVEAASPRLFRRTALTDPLPVPVRGGRLEELRELLNVSDSSWDLLRGTLVSWLVPDMPHPIVLLTGEQGTGKSSAARLLVGLLDPSPAPLRSSPRDERAWAVSAAGSYVVGVDNISHIPQWWSDALCRAVTGDASVDRRLYTDSDLSVLSLRRAMVLTSIDAGALRGDLSERLLSIELERIDPSRRRTDRQLQQAWDAAHPRLLGALLDLAVQTLAVLPEARASLTELPRMADFAEVLAAVDLVTGGQALPEFLEVESRLQREVVAGDPVGAAVQALMESPAVEGPWYSTPSVLLQELARHAPEPRPKSWPTDAARLGRHLRRIAPALRAVGIEHDAGKGNGDRYVSLRRTDERTRT